MELKRIIPNDTLRRLNPHLFAPRPSPGTGGIPRESDLHEKIFDECRRRGWIALHGSMAERTCRTLGEPDFVILADGGRVLRQLTTGGNNEDPSWAPDGRHLAFAAERSWGYGLLVVDVATGRERPILAGRRVGVPDWSPAIAPRR